MTRGKFDTEDSRGKTIDILGNRWRPQAVNQEGDAISKTFICTGLIVYGKNLSSTQMLEASRLGVGTVLRPERGERSKVK